VFVFDRSQGLARRIECWESRENCLRALKLYLGLSVILPVNGGVIRCLTEDPFWRGIYQYRPARSRRAGTATRRCHAPPAGTHRLPLFRLRPCVWAQVDTGIPGCDTLAVRLIDLARPMPGCLAPADFMREII